MYFNKKFFLYFLTTFLLSCTLFITTKSFASVDFITYDDLGGPRNFVSTGNVSKYSVVETTGGNLLNYSDGTATGLTITFTNAGTAIESIATEALNTTSPYIAAGTDAFNEFINISGATTTVNLGYASQAKSGSVSTIVITGVSSSKTYDVVIMGARGNTAYCPDRYTKYVISGVQSGFTNSSSAGTNKATTTLAGDSTYYCAGDNYANGYVAKWTNVVPTGNVINVAFSGVDASGNLSNIIAYANAIKITQNGAPDITPPTISVIASTTNSTSATITWTTNENSTSTVNYGTTTGYGTASTSASSVTSHSITLTGLTANTTYHFQVSSADSANNLATSSDYTFTTTAPDITPPTITSIASSTNSTTATITWTTNENSTSTVNYGTTTGYGTASTSASSVTSHSITLTGLTADTTYHFQVSSADASNNLATSSDYTFKTAATPVGATLVQGVIGSTPTNATTVTCTLSPVAAGNLIITTVSSDKAAGTYTVPTGFTLIQTGTGVGSSGAMAYKISTGGETTVAWTQTTSSTAGMGCWAAEYSGLVTNSVLDVSAENETEKDGTTGGYTSISSGTTGTTAQADELAIAFITCDTMTNCDTSRLWSNGFSEIGYNDVGGSGGTGLAIASKSLSSTGAVETTYSVTDTGDQMYAAVATFKISVGPDTTAPTISAIASSTNSTAATITWTTNENSTSTVNYGTTTGYGTASTSASSVTSHSITLTGLTADTTYHFQVSSADASNNLATSSDYTFKTAAASAGITLVQGVTGQTVRAATTVTCTLSPVVAGNLIITTVSSDKAAGTYTVPTGFTMVQYGSGVDNTSAGTVSGAMAYKIATGGETTVTWTQTNTATAGMSCWASEYSGMASSDVLDVSVENETQLLATARSSSISSGTTDSTSISDELAVFLVACDTMTDCDGGGTRNYTNGFTEVAFKDVGGSGGVGQAVASKVLSSTGAIETTYSFTDKGDQMYAMVATFKSNVVQTPTVSTAPRSVSVTSGNSTSTITWLAPTSNGNSVITNYKVYENGVLASTTSSTTFSLNRTGLTNKTSYSYYVTAINAVGESASSTISSTTPVDPLEDNISPSAISNLSASSTSDSSVLLSWRSPGDDYGGQQPQYVISISVDGMGAEYVKPLLASSSNEMTTLERIIREGSGTLNARDDAGYAITLPNHTTMVTSRGVSGVDGHNWTGNGDPAPTATLETNKGSYVASVFDVAHDNGLRTGIWSGKSKFSLFQQSYSSTTGALDTTGVDNGRDKIDYDKVQAGISAADLTADFISQMTANPYNLSFVHYQDPDAAGHGSGWSTTTSSTYAATLKSVDTQIGNILSMIENSDVLRGKTTVIITADHGGHGTTHGDTTNYLDYTIPFYVWGVEVSSSTDLYTLNPSSRTAPGALENPSYSGSQPVRNGDLGNLSLDLLGLSAIPGSTIDSSQNLSTQNFGTATSYDIRYSTSPITENNWSSATQVAGEPSPSVYGTTQTFSVTGLNQNTTYYFAMKTSDEGNNTSLVSNIASSTTSVTPDTTAPTLTSIASSTTSTTATITWTTNESSTSTVNYGLTTGYGTASTSASSVTSHSITLTGLTANTTYHFQVASGDASGNLATSSDYVFRTGFVISSVSAGNIGNNSANIVWSTNELSTSTIEYGPNTASSPFSTFLDSSSTTSGSVSLSNLVPCADYRYRVVSRNANDSFATSSDVVFSTSGCVGNATVSTSTSSYIPTTSSSTVSLTTSSSEGIVLGVPASYTSTTSSATFQLRQLNKNQFFSAVSAPTSLTTVGNYVYNLKALIDATTTLSTFDQPLTVTLSYSLLGLGDVSESTLVIYRYDGSSWYPLSNCSVNTSLHTVSCTTTSFSDFGIFGQQVTRRTSSGGGGRVSVVNTPVVATSSNTALIISELERLLLSLNNSASISTNYYGRDLTLGSIGEDVKKLQKFLNSQGFVISSVGLGSVGNETTYFGIKTQDALKKFQEAKGITPVSGYFGPKTRVMLNNNQTGNVSAQSTNNISTTTKVYLFTKDFDVGFVGEDALQLQKFLNAQGFIVSDIGSGSIGNETTKFGLKTWEALKKFQQAKGITPVSGYFGPKTRAVIMGL